MMCSNTFILKTMYMMKTIKTIAATTVIAMALASCSSDDNNILLPQQRLVPIQFSANPAVEVQTRAVNDDLVSARKIAQEGGFGVFAYYHDNTTYSSSSSVLNFMYNQQVTGTDVTSPVWTYTPVKYWPNETESSYYEAGTSATNNNVDKLSFFAYAPYINTPSGNNITGFAPDGTTGDPWVTYVSPTASSTADPAPGVDLLYANSLNKYNQIDVVNQKVKFEFKHALASLSYELKGNPSYLNFTKIEVIGWKNGLRIGGKLNLNDGTWSEINEQISKNTVLFRKSAPLPPTGGKWKVIPGDNQEFFVRIFYKDANGNEKILPEVPFKLDFEAGKEQVVEITIP